MSEEVREEFWRRQPGETEDQYACFVAYRELGPSRRLRKAAGVHYGMEDVGPEPWQYQRFKNLSSEHMWAARCEAHDAEQESLLLQRMAGYRLEALEAHHSIATLYLKILQKAGFDILRGNTEVRPSTLPSLISAVSTWHRLVLGESTERLEMTGDPEAVTREPDLSQLTAEEVRTFDDLITKAYGPLPPESKK